MPEGSRRSYVSACRRRPYCRSRCGSGCGAARRRRAGTPGEGIQRPAQRRLGTASGQHGRADGDLGSISHGRAAGTVRRRRRVDEQPADVGAHRNRGVGLTHRVLVDQQPAQRHRLIPAPPPVGRVNPVIGHAVTITAGHITYEDLRMAPISADDCDTDQLPATAAAGRELMGRMARFGLGQTVTARGDTVPVCRRSWRTARSTCRPA